MVCLLVLLLPLLLLLLGGTMVCLLVLLLPLLLLLLISTTVLSCPPPRLPWPALMLRTGASLVTVSSRRLGGGAARVLLTTEIHDASNVMSEIVTSSLVGVEQAFFGAFFFVGVWACLGALGTLGGGRGGSCLDLPTTGAVVGFFTVVLVLVLLLGAADWCGLIVGFVDIALGLPEVSAPSSFLDTIVSLLVSTTVSLFADESDIFLL